MAEVDIHVDTTRKIFISVTSSIIFMMLVVIFTVFVRPQLVMASDLATVVESVADVKEDIKEVNDSVSSLAATVRILADQQTESNIDYLQDRIRELEAKASRPGVTLTPDETYRLQDYQDRLDKTKRLRDVSFRLHELQRVGLQELPLVTHLSSA